MTKLHKIRLEDAKVGDYAFWKTDRFPGLLGGQIGNRPGRQVMSPISVSLGQAYVPSYQMAFKLEFVLSPTDGAYMLDELARLKAKHDEAHRTMGLMLEKAKGAVLSHLTDEPAADSTDQPQWSVKWRSSGMVKPDFYQELVHAPSLQEAYDTVLLREKKLHPDVTIDIFELQQTMSARVAACKEPAPRTRDW